jgi:hypothetical protein
MPYNASKSGWIEKLQQNSVPIAASLFIAVVGCGSFACVSCAHTPAGLQREQALYLVKSNALTGAQQVAPYVPPPCSSILEGVLAAGGDLLAVWATLFQRTLKEVRNGQLPGKGGNGGGPAPTAGPASG